jgi:uncharacterized protein (DUF736 family)
MIIGRFKIDGDGFSGFVETLTFQISSVRFVKRDKGADYTVRGPDDCELGAAWRKSGEWGDYLSVKLDSPALLAAINATMTLKASESGAYLLSWQRQRRNGDGQ